MTRTWWYLFLLHFHFRQALPSKSQEWESAQHLSQQLHETPGLSLVKTCLIPKDQHDIPMELPKWLGWWLPNRLHSRVTWGILKNS